MNETPQLVRILFEDHMLLAERIALVGKELNRQAGKATRRITRLVEVGRRHALYAVYRIRTI